MLDLNTLTYALLCLFSYYVDVRTMRFDGLSDSESPFLGDKLPSLSEIYPETALSCILEF